MRALTVFLLLTVTVLRAWAGWTTQGIPTVLDTNGPVMHLVGKEFSMGYRTMNVDGVKQEHMVIAYHSGMLRVVTRIENGWNWATFAHNARYPSVALDDQGRPHMTYFDTNAKKIFYARKLAQAGLGNCGVHQTWSCEEVPANVWGTPTGRSAIAVHGQTVHVAYEIPSSRSDLSFVFYYSKTIGSATWNVLDEQAGTGYTIREVDLQLSSQGTPSVLIVDEWGSTIFRRASGTWSNLPTVTGAGNFVITPSGTARACYVDYSSYQLRDIRPSGGSWIETTVDYNAGDKSVCAIAVPANAGVQPAGYYDPRIAYVDKASGSMLKYATLSGSDWQYQNVDAVGNVSRIELALDGDTKPVMVYFDPAVYSLVLARYE
jgi:hypothetical protein